MTETYQLYSSRPSFSSPMAATRVRCFHSNVSFTRLPHSRHRNLPTLPVSPNRVDISALKGSRKFCLPIGDGSSIRRVTGSGCNKTVRAVLEEKKTGAMRETEMEESFTCVMKFGGSSVASAERMREVADLILTFPEESPVIVLSPMGKTTNNLLLVMLEDVWIGTDRRGTRTLG